MFNWPVIKFETENARIYVSSKNSESDLCYDCPDNPDIMGRDATSFDQSLSDKYVPDLFPFTKHVHHPITQSYNLLVRVHAEEPSKRQTNKRCRLQNNIMDTLDAQWCPEPDRRRNPMTLMTRAWQNQEEYQTRTLHMFSMQLIAGRPAAGGTIFRPIRAQPDVMDHR